jgi:hypothetical protein
MRRFSFDPGTEDAAPVLVVEVQGVRPLDDKKFNSRLVAPTAEFHLDLLDPRWASGWNDRLEIEGVFLGSGR